MTHRLPMLVLGIALAACGGPGDPPQGAAPRIDPERVENRMEDALELEVGRTQDSVYAVATAGVPGATVDSLLAVLAVEDDDAPVRAHALLRMAERGLPGWDVYTETGVDDDPRVRAATLAAVGALAAVAPDEARPLFMRGLIDQEPRVQAKALQELGDNDPSLLRWYLDRGPPEELRPIATELLRLAEELGAPLVPDAAGNLTRTSASGVTLRWTLTDSVPELDAAIGRLEVVRPGGAVVLADSVPVVRNVIPAAVSPQGEAVAFEQRGQIVVQDLASGARRTLGTGIAPRVYPLTDSFVFFRQEGPPVASSAGTVYEYSVHAAPFAAGDAQELLRFTVNTRERLSPIRWARLREGGGFYLVHAGLTRQALPSPITTLRPPARTER